MEHVGEIESASDKQLHGTRRIVNCAQRISERSQELGKSTTAARDQGEQLASAVRDLELRLSPLYRCDISVTTPTSRAARRPTDRPEGTAAAPESTPKAARPQVALAGGAS
jgi:hypothetical protein